MKYNSSYLVCRDHVMEVKDFLSQFFPEEKDKYSHDGWITFKFPETGYQANLMKGAGQDITQNMTFEIACDSLEELEKVAEKYNTKVDSFLATETANPYRYYYIEVPGPANICKIEINYCEDVAT